MATVNYIPPITDRTQADIYTARNNQHDLVNKNIGAWNYTDANRVCNNIKYAAEYMYEKGFLNNPYPISIKTNWVETDTMTYEQLNTMIVQNINNLKTYSRADLAWFTIASIANMDFNIANWIELNIHALATQEPIPETEFHLVVAKGSGTGLYLEGTVVDIQADPPEDGQIFDHWSGDHLENIGNASHARTTYKMPNQDIALEANYTGLVPHTLKVVTFTGTQTYSLKMGANTPIEADPAPHGKVFHHWDVVPAQYDDNLYEPAATTHFTMPNEAVTLTAVYITKGEKYLNVINGRGTGWYEYDSYASVSSNKPANATFTNWTGDTQYLSGPATNEYNSVKIPDKSTITITAHWTTPPVPPVTDVPLTVIGGKISTTGETTGKFTEGNAIAITADPAEEGYTFSHWTKTGGGSLSDSYSANPRVNIGKTETTVQANYRLLEYHELTVITHSGTTRKTLEKYDYFSVNANPAPDGYVFDYWSGNTHSYHRPNSTSYFTTTNVSTGTYMGTTDRTITAVYRPINPHKLTVKQRSGDVTYTQAEFSTVQITADDAPAGMRFTGWSKSGVGSINSSTAKTITFTFGNGDTVLTPNYVNVWTVTVVGGGTINGSASAVLDQGGRYQLRTRGLAVYERFDGWTKDGPGTIENTASTSTYFVVGAGNTTITASITQYPDKRLSVYMRDPDTEVTTLISSKMYQYGSNILVDAEIAPNQTTFLAWEGDIEQISPSALASSMTIAGINKDTSITATYYYPEAPKYFLLSVYDGYPESRSVASGTQVEIRANRPSQGWEFSHWYGDTKFLVNPDKTLDTNAIIMPLHAITLYAKFKMVGELPLYRINVIDGVAEGTYTDAKESVHEEKGVQIDVPAGTQIKLTADPDIVGWTFDYWLGNFDDVGDIVLTNNPTQFTMIEDDLNIWMIRRELEKYMLYTTNATGAGQKYVGTYPIVGNLIDTDDHHYTFDNWTCRDAENNDMIQAIGDPSNIETTVTLKDRSLWVSANYTTHYRLYVVEGQDTGDGYYYKGEQVKTIYANTPPIGSNLQFDHWDDPNHVLINIYNPNPTVKMGDSVATITAIFTSSDARGNSIAVTGNDIHVGTITRSQSYLVNGIFAVGTIVFDKDGCMGIVTNLDPDTDPDTDIYEVKKLFYGGKV